MQWEPEDAGGFTAGTPWLPLADPHQRNVADQARDPASILSLYRDLISLRRGLGPGLRFLETAPSVLAYERGDAIVALNLGDDPAPAPAHGEILRATHAGAAGDPAVIPPHAGWIAREK
jgi:alpha-glucosidase